MFLEPQVQLSWYRIAGESYSMSNGMTVHQHDVHSLTGRAGLVVGKQWDMEQGRCVQTYLKAGLNHEFLGKQEAEVNGISFSEALRGTRAYYGVGMDWKLSDRVRVYGEVEREDGHHLSTPWGISAGVRYAF